MITPAVKPASCFVAKLTALKKRAEARLTEGNDKYISRQYSDAIYVGSEPKESYFIFSTLAEYMGEKLATIRRIGGIGSGLYVNEFILARLFPQVKEIDGMEIDPVLVKCAKGIKRELETVSGCDLSAVKFQSRDVLKADLSGYDALVGWFPLASHISDKQLLRVFRQLRPGTLLIQMSNWHPLSVAEDNERKGFREIHPAYPGYLPAAVYERL